MRCSTTLTDAHGPVTSMEAVVVGGYDTRCQREADHDGDHWFGDGSGRVLHCTVPGGYLAIYPYPGG